MLPSLVAPLRPYAWYNIPLMRRSAPRGQWSRSGTWSPPCTTPTLYLIDQTKQPDFPRQVRQTCISCVRLRPPQSAICYHPVSRQTIRPMHTDCPDSSMTLLQRTRCKPERSANTESRESMVSKNRWPTLWPALHAYSPHAAPHCPSRPCWRQCKELSEQNQAAREPRSNPITVFPKEIFLPAPTA